MTINCMAIFVRDSNAGKENQVVHREPGTGGWCVAAAPSDPFNFPPSKPQFDLNQQRLWTEAAWPDGFFVPMVESILHRGDVIQMGCDRAKSKTLASKSCSQKPSLPQSPNSVRLMLTGVQSYCEPSAFGVATEKLIINGLYSPLAPPFAVQRALAELQRLFATTPPLEKPPD
jgi:hypothetical protein